MKICEKHGQHDEKVCPLCKSKIEQYVNMLRGLSSGETYDVEYGRRFARVIHYVGGRSVHTFVEIATGNIWKAGGWNKPQPNGVRGNIWDEDLGQSKVDRYGAKYLR